MSILVFVAAFSITRIFTSVNNDVLASPAGDITQTAEGARRQVGLHLSTGAGASQVSDVIAVQLGLTTE